MNKLKVEPSQDHQQVRATVHCASWVPASESQGLSPAHTELHFITTASLNIQTRIIPPALRKRVPWTRSSSSLALPMLLPHFLQLPIKRSTRSTPRTMGHRKPSISPLDCGAMPTMHLLWRTRRLDRMSSTSRANLLRLTTSLARCLRVGLYGYCAVEYCVFAVAAVIVGGLVKTMRRH
jgi:hypothetical protein